MMVEISSFSVDLGAEKFFDWLAECDQFNEYTGISFSLMIKP